MIINETKKAAFRCLTIFLSLVLLVTAIPFSVNSVYYDKADYNDVKDEDLEAMREPVVHEDAPWQRKHLRLVLQSAEGSREDEPVIVAQEIRAVITALIAIRLHPQPLGRYQRSPVHHLIYDF